MFAQYAAKEFGRVRPDRFSDGDELRYVNLALIALTHTDCRVRPANNVARSRCASVFRNRARAITEATGLAAGFLELSRRVRTELPTVPDTRRNRLL